MEEDKLLKPKSYRVNDATADKIKEISVEIGGNQQEVFAKLIEAYEFQSGKAILTEKKADIEQFEKYINALSRMFMGSLEDNQNLTETVRTEYEALLKSKDSTIQELQGNLNLAKQLKEEAVTKSKFYSEENVKLNKELENQEKEYDLHVKNLQDMLMDKDSLNKALTDSCNELKQKVDSMRKDTEELSNIRAELSTIKAEHEDLVKAKIDIEKKLEHTVIIAENKEAELEQHEADALNRQQEQLQLAFDKKLLEMDKKYQEVIQNLKEERQKEIDKYQQKYFDLLERMKNIPILEE